MARRRLGSREPVALPGLAAAWSSIGTRGVPAGVAGTRLELVFQACQPRLGASTIASPPRQCPPCRSRRPSWRWCRCVAASSRPPSSAPWRTSPPAGVGCRAAGAPESVSSARPAWRPARPWCGGTTPRPPPSVCGRSLHERPGRCPSGSTCLVLPVPSSLSTTSTWCWRLVLYWSSAKSSASRSSSIMALFMSMRRSERSRSAWSSRGRQSLSTAPRPPRPPPGPRRAHQEVVLQLRGAQAPQDAPPLGLDGHGVHLGDLRLPVQPVLSAGRRQCAQCRAAQCSHCAQPAPVSEAGTFFAWISFCTRRRRADSLRAFFLALRSSFESLTFLPAMVPAVHWPRCGHFAALGAVCLCLPRRCQPSGAIMRQPGARLPGLPGVRQQSISNYVPHCSVRDVRKGYLWMFNRAGAALAGTPSLALPGAPRLPNPRVFLDLGSNIMSRPAGSAARRSVQTEQSMQDDKRLICAECRMQRPALCNAATQCTACWSGRSGHIPTDQASDPGEKKQGAFSDVATYEWVRLNAERRESTPPRGF